MFPLLVLMEILVKKEIDGLINIVMQVIDVIGWMAQGFQKFPSRMGFSFSNGGMIGGLDTFHQIEEKYLTFLFNHI